MSFWWVNHKQTSKQEISGGYIWSPTSNKDGSRNQTYLNLKELRARDLIFSFAHGKIGAIGITESTYIAGERPVAFGKSGEQWARNGWTVPVRWVVLNNPIRPLEHLSQIVPLLPEKYSPIRSNGYGNQKFYLLTISEQLGRLLLSIAQKMDVGVLDVLEESEQSVIDDMEEANIRKQPIPITEKVQLIKARRGQGLFRLNLERIEQACRLTGVEDRRFLIASHIKPWRESTSAEKLDGNNGLLLSPHVDKLFDRGWITFSNAGVLICANKTIEQLIRIWGLEVSRNVGPFNRTQRTYLEYHRARIFRK